MRRLAATAASTLLVAVVTASCSVGGNGQLQTIDQEELGGLDETTTSTTTTTTPATSVPDVVAPTAVATSTTIATESVELYFVDGSRLQPVTIELGGTATPNRVVEALLTVLLEGEIGIGLRTLLPADLVNDVEAPGTGVAMVDLATEPFNEIDSFDQRTAIGQIVMTLVRRPGIGMVEFTLDGVPLRVPRRGGLQSEPGEGVAYIDYESLLDIVDELEPTTTLTIETTPTTQPALEPPPVTPPVSTSP